jgi:2-hydroxy-3-keto-5-methylthiopentenyl-1-phosphate phosphatase
VTQVQARQLEASPCEDKILEIVDIIDMKLTSFYSSTSAILSDSFPAKLGAIKKMVACKPTRLIVVSDFDHTLTKFTSPQCHDVVGFSERYTEDFLQEFRGLFGQPTTSLADWWRLSHDLIVKKSGLTRPMLNEMLATGTVAVRDGLQDFAKNLRLNHVPLVIVSAGIRDVIAHTLAGCDLPTGGDHLFHIDANFMEFHDSGYLTAIYPHDPVHSESKQHVHVRAAHMFEFLHEQRSPTSAAHNTIAASILEQQEEDDELVIIEPEQSEQDGTRPLQSSHDVPPRPPGTDNYGNERKEEVIAIILGDRPHDFCIMDAHPWVHTVRVGFARTLEVGELFTHGHCDVVFVGEEHSLEAVHQLVDELIQLRKVAADMAEAGKSEVTAPIELRL